MKNGDNSQRLWYREDGSVHVAVGYRDGGPGIVINSITTFYESGRTEYTYNYSNHYLWHMSDSANATSTKEQYTNSQIENWLEFYVSAL